MADGDRNRRQSDDEAFKYNIVAQQAEIKTKVELLHDMVRLQLADHNKRLESLEAAVIGGTAGPGLLEKNRNIAKDVAKILGLITGAGVLLYKLASPAYDAYVGHWIPQKIGMMEPEQTSSKIVRKAK